MICPLCKSDEKNLWCFVEHWRICHAKIGKWSKEGYKQVYRHGYNCVCGEFFDSSWGMKRHLEHLIGETVENHFMAGKVMDALGELGKPKEERDQSESEMWP